MYKALSFAIIFYVISFNAYAQTPIANQEPDRIFQEAFYLFNSKQYNQAIPLFEQFIANSVKGEYEAQAMYASLIASVRLFHGNSTSKFNRLETEYPQHPLLKSAKVEMARVYFQNKEYNKVIALLAEVEPSQFSKSSAHEIKFRLAYSRFAIKSFDEALKGFDYLKLEKGIYQQPSYYYAGYIRYGKNEFDAALKDFLAVEKSEEYRKIVPGLVATVYYRQGKFAELLEYFDKKQDDSKWPENIHLMIGDAYYFINDYANAFSNYQKIINVNSIQKSNSLWFRIGRTALELENYPIAVNSLKQIVQREDSIYAPAMYFLGLSYLKQNEINLAIGPVQNAVSLAKNEELKNNALYLYSTLMIEKSNFKEAINSLEKLATNDPPKEISTQILELLAACYLKTNDYETALNYLKGQKNLSLKLKRSHQQAAYYLGVRSFNDGNYENAVSRLYTSLLYPIEEHLVVSAQYYIAESFGIQKDYSKAIIEYKKMNNIPNVQAYEEYWKSQYGLGYGYFNTKEYASALKSFEKYVDAYTIKKIKDFYPDAIVRWADCLYVLKFYEASLLKYKEALSVAPQDKDYIYFQMGSVQAALGMQAEALFSFNKVVKEFPRSIYIADALFQMAQLSLEESNYVSAVRFYSQVVNDFPKNALVPYALNKRAVSFQNLRQYDKAIADYKIILRNFPDHELVKSALLGLQETYASANQTEEFQDFLDQYKQGRTVDGSVESLEYEAIKSLYYNEKYEKAISSIKKFHNDYPNSEFTLELTFLKAESFYRLGNSDEALSSYDWVIKKERNPYLNRSLLRSADILIKSQEWSRAIPNLHQMTQIAESTSDRSSAYFGLAECFQNTQQWDSALWASQLVLQYSGSLSTPSSNTALIISARSHINLGSLEKAKDPLLQVLNASKDEQAAEASYLLSLIDYKSGYYEKSLESLYDFPAQFGVYDYWLGKAFLLIADNFIAIKEPLQAKATLASIIEKSPKAEIVEEARKKLESIESEERRQDDVD